MKNILKYSGLLALCLSLQGCLVASAVDLAATTVFTVGKIAVKGTGALIEAAIPDGEDDEKSGEKAQNSERVNTPAKQVAPSVAPSPTTQTAAPARPAYTYSADEVEYEVSEEVVREQVIEVK